MRASRTKRAFPAQKWTILILIFDDDWKALFEEYRNMIKAQQFPVDIEFEFLNAKEMVISQGEFKLNNYEQKHSSSNMIILQSQLGWKTRIGYFKY